MRNDASEAGLGFATQLSGQRQVASVGRVLEAIASSRHLGLFLPRTKLSLLWGLLSARKMATRVCWDPTRLSLVMEACQSAHELERITS